MREGGNVYEATCPQLTAAVVVRLFPEATRFGERALSAFNREVSLATALDHPNIARLLGAGTLDDGTPFSITERLQGETLKELLERRGALSAAEVQAIVAGVSAGLVAAHAAGVVHGALRLEDVFVVEGDLAFVKLLNFGARHLSKKKRALPVDDQSALASFIKLLRTGAAASSPEATPQQRPARRRAPTARSASKKSKAAAAPRASAGGAASDPSSVSQLFFAEGERLSNEALAAHAALASTKFAIPRSRGAMVVWTVGIFLAMTGLAFGGWLSVRKPLAAARSTASPSARAPEVAPVLDPSLAAPKSEATPTIPAPPRDMGTRSAQKPMHERHARLQPSAPPLRGYVWSPAENRLVRKTLAPTPPPSEP